MAEVTATRVKGEVGNGGHSAGANGDLALDSPRQASDRRGSEGEFQHDSPYRPGVRPKVPTSPGGGGGDGAPNWAGSGVPALGSGVSYASTTNSRGRAAGRSPSAAGPQTFGNKYMPFAAGFSYMAGEAPVYRSSRLHSINPTAAVSEDTSYLYTLDSGATTPASRAANPDKSAEHVRNTAAAASSKGGFMGKVFAPIK